MNFFKLAFLQNVWLWFHILTGGMATKFLNAWFNDLSTFAMVLVAAVGWEVFEGLTSDLKAIYGSIRNFIFDAIGDICGAMIMCIVVLI